ncbi:MAG: hypothetical protein JWP04_2413 [Belnapia sp.]|nr:hypothetical protein [Belnapia sp.]
MVRPHIMSASGSGTLTLGQAAAARLGCPLHDAADAHFWLPTDPPFTLADLPCPVLRLDSAAPVALLTAAALAAIPAAR